MTDVSEGFTALDVRSQFDRVCNWGRWGSDDQRGTLNLIDDDVRLAALATVTNGRSYSVARTLDPEQLADVLDLEMITPSEAAGRTCRDAIRLAAHGFSVTHLDAPAHCFFDGLAWNGRRADEIVTARGLAFGDVRALSGGIFTRGVLLDVAGARGTDALPPGAMITAADLDAAERLAGTVVRPGDAVVVHAGEFLGAGGREPAEKPAVMRAGIGLDCLGWLRDRDVAVYSGDCVDRFPSPAPEYPDYFHQIALAGMGLVLLDLPDVERLRGLVALERRAWFLLQAAPLPILGATGSAVNPIVVF